MSEEAFRKFLRPYIEQRIPFRAYWHPAGMGLIRLDEVRVPVIPPCELHQREGHAQTKPHRLGKRGLATWEKNLARLRKQTWGRVITVVFDGTTLKEEINHEHGIDH